MERGSWPVSSCCWSSREPACWTAGRGAANDAAVISPGEWFGGLSEVLSLQERPREQRGATDRRRCRRRGGTE